MPNLPAAVIGGKGRTLQRLAQAGFRIPVTHYSPTDLAATWAEVGPPLVVRSSASVEDGQLASFAGQFTSVLNVASLEALQSAVQTCLASVRTPALAAYCQHHGLDPATIRMGYLVQRQLAPELAGVAFSVNPITGADDVVIEATAGLADRLLQGETAPLSPDHPLLAAHRPEIERVTRAVQRLFGAPQDVEFAVQEGQLYLVQARPITRIGLPADIGEWTSANFRDGGVASEVCTPLMWWLFDAVWAPTLKQSLRDVRLDGPDFEAGRVFFGRPYWNIGVVKQRLGRLPGFDERNFDADVGIVTGTDATTVANPLSPLAIVRTLPQLLAIERFVDRQVQAAQRLLADFPDIERDALPPPPDALSSLRLLIEGDYQRTESTYFRVVFAAFLAKQQFMALYPAMDHATLLAGLPPLRHLAPARALLAMAARGDTDVTPLLEEFRYVARRELDISAPRWDEDRAWVEQLLHQQPMQPPPTKDPRAAYRAARITALAHLPWFRRADFTRRLERLRHLIWLREETRDVSNRLLYLVRRYVQAVASQHALGDDVFFMTLPEILIGDRSAIAARRATFEGYRAFEPPAEIGRGRPATSIGLGGPMRGLPASAGLASGAVCVVRVIEDTARLAPGSVLVCRYADPGWATSLATAAAVVAETGGLLSHVAVVCRELGIPAVLGLPHATSRLRDGDVVQVDGGTGAVTVIAAASATPSADRAQ